MLSHLLILRVEHEVEQLAQALACFEQQVAGGPNCSATDETVH